MARWRGGIELAGHDARREAPVGGDDLVRPDHREAVAQGDHDRRRDAGQLRGQHQVLGDVHAPGPGRVVEPVRPEQVERVGGAGVDGCEPALHVVGDQLRFGQLGERRQGDAERPAAIGRTVADVAVDDVTFEPQTAHVLLLNRHMDRCPSIRSRARSGHTARADPPGRSYISASISARLGPDGPAGTGREGVRWTSRSTGRRSSSMPRPGDRCSTSCGCDCGLRSMKDGCAPEGSCGACTVIVDGHAVVSCARPAERVAGRTVETLEGLPADVRALWADAFVATGASQCGYCSPGIVMKAEALLRRDPEPAREAIARALAGNLCRCTGYASIIDAIELAAGIRRGRPGRAGRPCRGARRVRGPVRGTRARPRARSRSSGTWSRRECSTVPCASRACRERVVRRIDTSRGGGGAGRGGGPDRGRRARTARAGTDRAGLAAAGGRGRDDPVRRRHPGGGRRRDARGGRGGRGAGGRRAGAADAGDRPLRCPGRRRAGDPRGRQRRRTPRSSGAGMSMRRSPPRRTWRAGASARSRSSTRSWSRRQPSRCRAAPPDRTASSWPDHRVHVYSPGQGAWEDRRQVASFLGLAPAEVLVTQVSTGGAFGGKEDLSVQGAGGAARGAHGPAGPAPALPPREHAVPRQAPPDVAGLHRGLRRGGPPRGGAGPHRRGQRRLRERRWQGPGARGGPRLRAVPGPERGRGGDSGLHQQPAVGRDARVRGEPGRVRDGGRAGHAGRAGRHRRLGDPLAQRARRRRPVHDRAADGGGGRRPRHAARRPGCLQRCEVRRHRLRHQERGRGQRPAGARARGPAAGGRTAP